MFWNYFHPYIQPTKNFIWTICLLPIIIQKFICAPCSSKYLMFFIIVIHVHVVFFWHNCLGIHPYISTWWIFHPNNSSTCNYHPKSSLILHFHPNISSIFWLSSMYAWKNIFHVIPMWLKDILWILCLCHQNIPNIFDPVHKLTLTFTCSLLNIIGLEHTIKKKDAQILKFKQEIQIKL